MDTNSNTSIINPVLVTRFLPSVHLSIASWRDMQRENWNYGICHLFMSGNLRQPSKKNSLGTNMSIYEIRITVKD